RDRPARSRQCRGEPARRGAELTAPPCYTSLPRPMSDDPVQSQLHGKQVVFLFLAVTARAVVIFLCGGKGRRGLAPPAATQAGSAPVEASPGRTRTAASTGGLEALPVSVEERLTYVDRLQTTGPVPEERIGTPARSAGPLVESP